MALSPLPPNVPQKRQADNAVQQAFDQVATVVNQILQFLKGIFTITAGLIYATVDYLTVNQTATINILKAVTTTITNLTVGTLTVTGNETVGGNLTVTGTATANSMVSAQGFKALIGVFTMTAGPSGTAFPTSDAATSLGVGVINTTSVTNLGSQVFGFRAVRTGSVTAITGTAGGSSIAKTFTVTLYKNGAALALAGNATFTSGNFAGYSASAAKGTYAFVAGDLLELRIRSSNATAGTGIEAMNGFIEIEQGA